MKVVSTSVFIPPLLFGKVAFTRNEAIDPCIRATSECLLLPYESGLLPVTEEYRCSLNFPVFVNQGRISCVCLNGENEHHCGITTLQIEEEYVSFLRSP